MKINLHSPIEEVQVPIIPLIDVIFCILTFFLVAALQFTRQQAINVDLPKATTGTSGQIPQSLIVSVDSIGQIYVEEQPVRTDLLAQTLQSYSQKNPNAKMLLYASPSLSYNDVIQVLDAMRQVGGDRVALATLPASSTQPAQSVPLTPYFPTAPGVEPSPNSTPVAPLNPLGSSNTTPSPSQLPVFPIPGQSVDGQSVNPVLPTTPAPQATTTPQR